MRVYYYLLDANYQYFHSASEAVKEAQKEANATDCEIAVIVMDVQVSAANMLNVLSGGGYAENLKIYRVVQPKD